MNFSIILRRFKLSCFAFKENNSEINCLRDYIRKNLVTYGRENDTESFFSGLIISERIVGSVSIINPDTFHDSYRSFHRNNRKSSIFFNNSGSNDESMYSQRIAPNPLFLDNLKISGIYDVELIPGSKGVYRFKYKTDVYLGSLDSLLYHLYIKTFNCFLDVDEKFRDKDTILYSISEEELINLNFKGLLKIHLIHENYIITTLRHFDRRSNWPINLSVIALSLNLVPSFVYLRSATILLFCLELFKEIICSVKDYILERLFLLIKMKITELFPSWRRILDFLSIFSSKWNYCDKERGLRIVNPGTPMFVEYGRITGFELIDTFDFIGPGKGLLESSVKASLDKIYYQCQERRLTNSTVNLLSIDFPVTFSKNKGFRGSHANLTSSFQEDTFHIMVRFKNCGFSYSPGSDVSKITLTAAIEYIKKKGHEVLETIYVNDRFLHLGKRSNWVDPVNKNFLLISTSSRIAMGSLNDSIFYDLVFHTPWICSNSKGKVIYFLENSKKLEKYREKEEEKTMLFNDLKNFFKKRMVTKPMIGNSIWKKITFFINEVNLKHGGQRAYYITKRELNDFENKILSGDPNEEIYKIEAPEPSEGSKAVDYGKIPKIGMLLQRNPDLTVENPGKEYLMNVSFPEEVGVQSDSREIDFAIAVEKIIKDKDVYDFLMECKKWSFKKSLCKPDINRVGTLLNFISAFETYGPDKLLDKNVRRYFLDSAMGGSSLEEVLKKAECIKDSLTRGLFPSYQKQESFSQKVITSLEKLDKMGINTSPNNDKSKLIEPGFRGIPLRFRINYLMVDPDPLEGVEIKNRFDLLKTLNDSFSESEKNDESVFNTLLLNSINVTNVDRMCNLPKRKGRKNKERNKDKSRNDVEIRGSSSSMGRSKKSYLKKPIIKNSTAILNAITLNKSDAKKKSEEYFKNPCKETYEKCLKSKNIRRGFLLYKSIVKKTEEKLNSVAKVINNDEIVIEIDSKNNKDKGFLRNFKAEEILSVMDEMGFEEFLPNAARIINHIKSKRNDRPSTNKNHPEEVQER